MTGFFCHIFFTRERFCPNLFAGLFSVRVVQKRYICTQINENYVLTFAKDICKILEKEYIISLICQRHFLNFCLRIDKLKHILACSFCM